MATEQDGVRCAVCDTREDAIENLTKRRFKINKMCGHYFCDSCLGREFATRRSDRPFKCPICLRQGRDRNVVQAYMEEKTLDELICENDTAIRKEVLEVFGKTEEEFATPEEYNDYIEKREDLIYTLANRLTCDESEVLAARAALDAEKKANAAAIAKYRARQDEENRRMRRQVEQEEKKKEAALKQAQELERLYQQRLEEYKKQLREVNLGERDKVTVSLEPPAMPTLADLEAEGNGDDDNGGAGGMEASYREEIASMFHTNLRLVVGEQPAITEIKLPGKPQPLDRDVVGRASGFGPEQRYKRSWQEAVAGFFLTSVEARNRLAQVVS